MDGLDWNNEELNVSKLDQDRLNIGKVSFQMNGYT